MSRTYTRAPVLIAFAAGAAASAWLCPAFPAVTHDRSSQATADRAPTSRGGRPDSPFAPPARRNARLKFDRAARQALADQYLDEPDAESRERLRDLLSVLPQPELDDLARKLARSNDPALRTERDPTVLSQALQAVVALEGCYDNSWRPLVSIYLTAMTTGRIIDPSNQD